MAGCAAPRSLSGPATGSVRRLGTQEKAPRSLRYFCPMTLHPYPTGEPCLGEEVGPPQAGGSRQEGVPPGSPATTPGLPTVSKGRAVLAPTFPVGAELRQNEGKTLCNEPLR